jgi:hypothetical protein
MATRGPREARSADVYRRLPVRIEGDVAELLAVQKHLRGAHDATQPRSRRIELEANGNGTSCAFHFAVRLHGPARRTGHSRQAWTLHTTS